MDFVGFVIVAVLGLFMGAFAIVDAAEGVVVRAISETPASSVKLLTEVIPCGGSCTRTGTRRTE